LESAGKSLSLKPSYSSSLFRWQAVAKQSDFRLVNGPTREGSIVVL
jgi:hypothetical protein